MSTRARVLVVGATGRMGERVRALLAGRSDLRLGAALERPGHPRLGERLEEDVVLGCESEPALRAADVAIVFANPAASVEIASAAADLKVPCAIGTTGLEPAQRAAVARAAERIPLVLTANFSVAVNVLFQLAREAAALLGPGFDAEIVELHHAAKLDAPSGTALRIAEAVAEGRGQSLAGHAVMSREGITGARPRDAIGIQTLRGGDNPGEHTLFFVGAGERLELVHRAATRDHFAHGALRAAAWLLAQPPGLYDMEAVLGLGTGKRA